MRGEGKSVYQLGAQVLRVAANRVPPLALRLREGPIIFRPGPTYYGGGVVNDTTPVLYWILLIFVRPPRVQKWIVVLL